MEKVFEEIRQERRFQDEKWGVQNHHPLMWNAILMEEVGEVSEALLQNRDSIKCYREELIQVAAVAIAAVENLDRIQESILSGGEFLGFM